MQIDKKFLILLFRILKGVSPAGTNGISADGQAGEQSPSCRAYRPAAAVGKSARESVPQRGRARSPVAPPLQGLHTRLPRGEARKGERALLKKGNAAEGTQPRRRGEIPPRRGGCYAAPPETPIISPMTRFLTVFYNPSIDKQGLKVLM